MNARRFYTAHALQREVAAAGLQIKARRERPVLPARSLVVAAWVLKAPAFARCGSPRATAGKL